MATRWIRQRNCYSCGPVALMNILKWRGNKVAYARDYRFWKQKCNCDEEGSPLYFFINALYSIENIVITPRSIPNIQVIDDALKKNKIVVMKSASTYGDEIIGHYFLVTERKRNAFFCVNYEDQNRMNHGWVSKQFFKDNFLKYHKHYCTDCGIAPYAWILRKS